MASLTSNQTVIAPLTEQSASNSVIRIEPPRGWFNLRLKELWNYRELLYFLVWRDVKVRYKQTVIGIAWVVLQPLMTMGVFTIFFGRLAKLPSDGLPYPVFYFSALVPWAYFSSALQSCTNVVVDNQRVITKVFFPRLVLPISAVVSGLVDFTIGFVVLLVVISIYGIKPTRRGTLAARIVASRRAHRPRRRPLDVSAKRAVSRRPLRRALPHPGLDVRLPSRLPQLSCPTALALALRPQSHGRRH